MNTGRTYITAVQRPRMLHGTIVRSDRVLGKIESIIIPDLSDDFVVVTARDIPGSNSLKVQQVVSPILADESVAYRGQPIAAVFGPDRESSLLAAQKIQVIYREFSSDETGTEGQGPLPDDGAGDTPDPSQDVSAPPVPPEMSVSAEDRSRPGLTIAAAGSPDPQDPPVPGSGTEGEPDADDDALLKEDTDQTPVDHQEAPAEDQSGSPEGTAPTPASSRLDLSEMHFKEVAKRVTTWGTPDILFAEADEVAEQTYLTSSERSPQSSPTGAIAEVSDDRIFVKAASQWPFHVRNTVADACGFQKRRVVVSQANYRPTHDEKLIYPSAYAALAAIAALKSGRPAQLISDEPSYRPEIIVHRRTALNKEKMPVAAIIDVQVNLGAFPMFVKEVIEHVTTGAAPIYDIGGVRITVRVIKTPTPPRHHFNGLGFAACLFSAEAHFSHITSRKQLNPLGWRIKNLKSNQFRPADQLRLKYGLIRELLERAAANSDFNRKFAAYEMQRRRSRGLSTFSRYARGIGLACGYGINGFSRDYRDERRYSISMRLDTNDAVTVSLSFCESEAEGFWRKVISEILNINERQIVFSYEETSKIPDSGPDVLRRDTSVITGLIVRCCESIKSQRFKEPLPIDVRRGYSSTPNSDDSTPPFESVSWGAVVLELEIDTITLEPQVKGIWSAFDCGRVFYPERLKAALTVALYDGIFRCGGIRAEQGVQPHIDVDIAVHDDGLPTSAAEAAFGLLSAAYAAAVSQALNIEVTSLPFGPEQILNAIGERS